MTTTEQYPPFTIEFEPEGTADAPLVCVHMSDERGNGYSWSVTELEAREILSRLEYAVDVPRQPDRQELIFPGTAADHGVPPDLAHEEVNDVVLSCDNDSRNCYFSRELATSNPDGPYITVCTTHPEIEDRPEVAE